jgi:hypothetical protein
MKHILFIYCVLVSSLAHAFGEPYQWSAGWAQGTYEYTGVMDEKNSLYIACPDKEPLSIVATVNGEKYGTYTNKPFTVIVNNTPYETPYKTDSREEAKNFYDMWSALRHANEIKLQTPDGKEILLPITKTFESLPSSRSNEFRCYTGFAMELIKAKQQADKPTNTTPLQPAELSVGWYHHSMWKIPVIEITSRTDDVFIQNIILNRGNCRITIPGEKPNNPRLPSRLKFGTKIEFYVSTMCQILEADIVTNRGTITYTFQ